MGAAARPHPSDRERVTAALARSSERDEPFACEYRLLRRDGSVAWVRDEARLVRFTADEKPAIHGLMFDITEQKRAASTREKLEAELRQSQKMEAVGRLAGGVAHDFNNMLQTILTDVVMPRMSGRDLWEQVSALRPSLKCLYMSGYTANVISHHGVLDEGIQFLQKPFSVDDLAEKLREALEGR